MAAVTICSGFGTPQNKVWHCFHCFPIYLFPMKWWDRMPWSSFSECWALSQIFHSPLSLSTFFSFFFFTRQQKRHWCIEQSFGLCGRGWDDLGEWHWNMYNIICETNQQSSFDAWCRMLRAGALGWMTQRDGMGREVGAGFRMGNTCTPVADSCWCMAKPLQYCKVISLQLK